jgi:putative spermidine/putrescine transport system permease protein
MTSTCWISCWVGEPRCGPGGGGGGAPGPPHLFHGRPRLQVGALLAGPIGWLVLGYLGSLTVLLIAAFWSVDALSGELIKGFTFDNYKELWNTDVYRTVAFRTIGIASAVTLTDALLAFPIAFYMAKLASRRAKGLLVVAVLMPLWSFYLVKVYAWQTMLSAHGIINWALDPIGLNGPGFGATAVWIVESYLWLPYMILPIYAGLERIPDSLLSASEDLGAKPFETFRRVILPMAFPAVVAGSIFTFSLTLGDYITPSLVSPDTQFIGNVVFSSHTNNLPLASAFATVPIVVMVVYLLIARRLGAFEHL